MTAVSAPINAGDTSQSNTDILIFGLTADGDSIFIESLGNDNADEP